MNQIYWPIIKTENDKNLFPDEVPKDNKTLRITLKKVDNHFNEILNKNLSQIPPLVTSLMTSHFQETILSKRDSV